MRRALSARGANRLSPLSTGPVARAQRSICPLAKSGNFSHKLAKARPLHLDIGSGRQTSIAASPMRVVSAPLNSPSPRRAESFAVSPVPDELLDHVVAERDAPVSTIWVTTMRASLSSESVPGRAP